MLRNEHYLLSLLVLLIVFKLGILNLLTFWQQIVFLISYSIFAFKITPDYDLKLKWLGVKHRGTSHTLAFWLAVAIVAYIGISLAISYLNLPIQNFYAVIFSAGMVVGAWTHLLGDWLHNRIRINLFWSFALAISIFIVLVFL